MNNQAIQKYNFHSWANKRVFGKLQELSLEVYEQEIKSVFKSISKVVSHMYQVDGMWLSVMSGDHFDQTMKVIANLKNESFEKNLDQMVKLFDQMDENYRSFVMELEDPNLSMTIKHPHYGEMTVSVSDLVDHVVNHGTYHRGNITAMLRQLGYEGVPTDYIIYLYERPKQ